MCSYYHDLIYLAAIVQVASIVSDRIWWSFLVVRSLDPPREIPRDALAEQIRFSGANAHGWSCAVCVTF